MTDKPDLDIAATLYTEGMKYNWRHTESPANAALSRANLERAAALGHTKAIRELAEMIFVGSGGPKDEEHALWLKWAAFVRGDQESLEELSALLDSYSDNATDPEIRTRASNAARKTEEAEEQLRYVGGFVHELFRAKRVSAGSE